VVLIIGILAAIALPQYTKAVEKSRSSEALLVLKAMSDAANRYYLLTGGYTGMIIDPTNSSMNLDIDPPTTSKNFTYTAGTLSQGGATLLATRINSSTVYSITYTLSSGALTSRGCAPAGGPCASLSVLLQ